MDDFRSAELARQYETIASFRCKLAISFTFSNGKSWRLPPRLEQFILLFSQYFSAHSIPTAVAIICFCLFPSGQLFAKQPTVGCDIPNPQDRSANISKALAGLNATDFRTRKRAFQKLKTWGFEAADEVLANCDHSDIEIRESCPRLIQLLPSYQSLIQSLFPDENHQPLDQLLRDFHRQNFVQKVCRIQQIAKLPKATANATAMYCLARFEADEVIRQFALTHVLESYLPVDKTQADSRDWFSLPVSAQTIAGNRLSKWQLESVIPNRESPSVSQHSANASWLENQNQMITSWMIGTSTLVGRENSETTHQPLQQQTACQLTQNASHECTVLRSALTPRMTVQALWIRHALIQADQKTWPIDLANTFNTELEFHKTGLATYLDLQTKDTIVEQSSDRYQIKLQCIARLACWNALQMANQDLATFQSHSMPVQDDSVRTDHAKNQLLSVANLPEVFLPNSQVICDAVVKLRSSEILTGLLLTHETQLAANLPAALAISNAAFILGDSATATRILQQFVIHGNRSPTLLQYAVISQELGYRQTQKFLLTHLASLPTNDQTSQVIARLLLAESEAEDCNYQLAANLIERTLVTIDQSTSLATRLRAQMPCDFDQIISRYYYFCAQEAVSQFDLGTAKRMLTIGNAINPHDTNILALAFRITDQPIEESSWQTFDLLDHQHFSLTRLAPTSIQSLLPTWTAPIPGPFRSGNWDQVPLRSETNLRQQILDIGTLNCKAIGVSPPMDWITNSQTLIQLPLLEGNHLQKNISDALAKFENQMHEENIVVDSPNTAAVRHQSSQQLANLFNRWSFLASHSNGDIDLAYQRSKLATQIMPNSAAYFDTLAICCQRSGRLAEAVNATRVALALQPNNPDFQARLASLESLAISDLR